jgi:hypothetical protein
MIINSQGMLHCEVWVLWRPYHTRLDISPDAAVHPSHPPQQLGGGGNLSLPQAIEFVTLFPATEFNLKSPIL